ncbi:hypothetical protein GLYMA_10G175050v4 [Glycine max]|nr:hypothetical protein GLYMA_10G175050v4 [Glycine max]KAH1138775.1 hypothetical protein GYH30_028307 [Glycine max]
MILLPPSPCPKGIVSLSSMTAPPTKLIILHVSVPENMVKVRGCSPVPDSVLFCDDDWSSEFLTTDSENLSEIGFNNFNV